MPIRLRLTLWNCLLFGTILAVIISIVYYSHKQSHYKDVDLNYSQKVILDVFWIQRENISEFFHLNG